jgi:inorganic pyrophosphatase
VVPSVAMNIHRYRPHPWHGITSGPAFPERLHAYIEITPFDSVKYEVDKESGFLMVDRPQRLSSLPPTLYGFVPQTYCGPRIAALAGTPRGDGDPLDICVLSERMINRADILLRARPLGGLLMVDKGEADDKIVAVIEDDPIWGDLRELDELPAALVERLRHYFTTYKMAPGGNPVTIDAAYGRERARAVLTAAAEDYTERFGAMAKG